MLTRPGDGNITDATPTRPVRVVDPFSGTAKHNWRPPTQEKKRKRALPSDIMTRESASPPSYVYAQREVQAPKSSPTPVPPTNRIELDDVSDFHLTEDELDRCQPIRRPQSQLEMERQRWDEAVTNAIEKSKFIIDLR